MLGSASSMTLLIFYLALAIGVSFVCSILEAVFLSITPSSVAAMRHERPRTALKLARLREDLDRPLAAILTLNTIAHTVGAAGVGAQAERIWGSASLAVISAVVTLLILVFSEIIPKTLGALHWRALAGPATHTIGWLVVVTLPFVWLAQGITRWLSRGQPEGVSRDELSALAEAARASGAVSEEEAGVVRNLVGSWKRPVREILTPRTVVTAFRADETVTDALAKLAERPYSRLPVYGDRIDEIKGYVLRTELQARAAEGAGERTVETLLRPIHFVPETAPLGKVWCQLIRRRTHIAAAVDEYGSFAGVLTMEDLLETLLGQEIVDESDVVVDLREWAREEATQRPGESPVADSSADR